MNHLPIYGDVLPAFCSEPGDTANPAAVIDCPICLDRMDRKDQEARQEHFSCAQKYLERWLGGNQGKAAENG